MSVSPYEINAGEIKRRKVYLAGPMRGLPNLGFDRFDAAAAELRQRGYDVISPADLDREVGFDPSVGCPGDFDLDAAIRRDTEAIMGCDAIAMLPGHEQSRGATAERHLAIWRGIDVLEYPSMAPLECGKPAVGVPSVALIKDGETVVNEHGGKQSHLSARFDCIPPEMLKLLAQCLGYGARRYGVGNWRQIPIEDNLGHALNHINEFRLGDQSEPHLVNAIARLTFALSQAVESGDQAADYVHPDMVAAG